DGGGLAVQGSPPTEQLVAFFSGPVRVDADGRARIGFDIPEFNGTARVMAVAWSKDAVGQANADVVIRDPVVITAGAPRFLAAGSRRTLGRDLHNSDAPAGAVALWIPQEGTAGLDFGQAPQSVTLEANGRDTLFVPVSALSTGRSVATVALVHEGGTAV